MTRKLQQNTRLDILEHEMKGLRTNVREAIQAISELKDALAQFPKASSSKDRLTMIGGTVAVYTAVLGILNGWFDGRAAPMAQTLSRIERSTDDVSVLRYRIEQLETLFSPGRQARAPTP